MNFSDVVKCVRSELCYSQADLAKELGVTEQTVRRWEHGGSMPQYAAKRKLFALCDKNKIKVPKSDNVNLKDKLK